MSSSSVLLESYDAKFASPRFPDVTPSQEAAGALPVETMCQGSSSPPSETVVFLHGRVHPEFVVEQCLPVAIDFEDDGTCVVADEVFGVYGTGPSEEAALDDYVVSLRDYREIVLSEERINPNAAPLADRLRAYLRDA